MRTACSLRTSLKLPDLFLFLKNKHSPSFGDKKGHSWKETLPIRSLEPKVESLELIPAAKLGISLHAFSISTSLSCHTGHSTEGKVRAGLFNRKNCSLHPVLEPLGEERLPVSFSIVREQGRLTALLRPFRTSGPCFHYTSTAPSY